MKPLNSHRYQDGVVVPGFKNLGPAGVGIRLGNALRLGLEVCQWNSCSPEGEP